ncbi:MAG: hypothetical protein ACU0D1_09390 [Pseudooceanicola nanhaiensis]
MRIFTAATLMIALGAGAGHALDLKGPALAAASNFGQGFEVGMMSAALELPVRDFRDAVYWREVEQGPGRFVFDTPRTMFPDLVGARGARMSLTVNNGHPAHDGGTTPLSPEAVRAFGHHAAQTALRFPAIRAVEVGNEFNSANFVTGPLEGDTLDARARAYAALLHAVAQQVRAVRPGVRIVGGGVHSIPTGYLSRLTALGAAADMDAIALHPYSTPIEHLARQIAVMRRDPALAAMPVEITEFGSQDPDAAPDVLVRAYCQMALSGVSRAVWYALNTRGDGYAPLVGPDLELTAAGRAYRFVQSEFAGQPVEDIAPDPFTYGCRFPGGVILWGMPRTLEPGEGVTARDATGKVLEGRSFRLGETAPLILTAGSGAVDHTLGPQEVLADSFHQFPYPEAGADSADAAGFARFAVSPRGRAPFVTMPGQDRPGMPWTPYLGLSSDRSVRLLPESLLPGGGGTHQVGVEHVYVAPEAMEVDLTGWIDPPERSADGVVVTLALDGEEVGRWSVIDRLELDERALALPAGAELSIRVAPGETSTGDVTGYRFTLRRAG